jgi:hypothetical protein
LVTPRFLTDRLELTLDLDKEKSTNYLQLVEIDRLLERTAVTSEFVYELNLEPQRAAAHRAVYDIFSLTGAGTTLNVNLTMAAVHLLADKTPAVLFQIPVLCCDRIQTGVCDQLLVLVNIIRDFNVSNSAMIANTTGKPFNDSVTNDAAASLAELGKNIGFLYQYYGFTIQQQSELLSNSGSAKKKQQKSVTSSRVNSSSSSSNTFESFYDDLILEGDTLLSNNNEYDYYTDEPYESNERFYFELKTMDLTTADTKTAHSVNSTDHDNEDSDLADYDDQVAGEGGSSSRSNERNSHLKYEFELTSCVFSHLNVTFTANSSSIIKQIKQLTQLKNVHQPVQLSLQQTRQLFTLNKHNGVLSSRKIINLVLPGVYTFTVTLKISFKKQSNNSNDTAIAVITKIPVDQTQFKLVVLPPNSAVKPAFKYLYNYFKFDREFYKFKAAQNVTSLGHISLLNKYARLKSSPNASSFQIEYELAGSKFKNASSIYSKLTLNRTNGQLVIDMSALRLEELRPYLNDENELVVYGLARVGLDALMTKTSARGLNRLEYSCEISISFSQLVEEHEARARIVSNKGTSSGHRYEDSDDLLKYEDSIVEDDGPPAPVYFGSSHVLLKIAVNIRPNSRLHRFVALLGPAKLGMSNVTIRYSMSVDSTLFAIDPRSGELVLTTRLTANPLPVLNITACLIDSDNNELVEENSNGRLNASDCASIRVDFELINRNSDDLVNSAFEFSQYNGTIRDDSLPGTIITTLTLNERLASKSSSSSVEQRAMEFFIIGAEATAGQFFAVANDGKVYTRLMVDTAYTGKISLDLIVLVDFKFKSVAKLVVTVVNVLSSGGRNSRPVCPSQNLIRLAVNENVPLGFSIIKIKELIITAANQNHNYELVTAVNDEDSYVEDSAVTKATTTTIAPGFSMIPFTVDKHGGEVKTSAIVDYELASTHNFFIKISNNVAATVATKRGTGHHHNWSTHCLVKLDVTVNDLNDNLPDFVNGDSATPIIKENAPLGTILTQVTATDLDSDLNGVVKYSLVYNQQVRIQNIEKLN